MQRIVPRLLSIRKVVKKKKQPLHERQQDRQFRSIMTVSTFQLWIIVTYNATTRSNLLFCNCFEVPLHIRRIAVKNQGSFCAFTFRTRRSFVCQFAASVFSNFFKTRTFSVKIKFIESIVPGRNPLVG